MFLQKGGENMVWNLHVLREKNKHYTKIKDTYQVRKYVDVLSREKSWVELNFICTVQ